MKRIQSKCIKPRKKVFISYLAVTILGLIFLTDAENASAAKKKASSIVLSSEAESSTNTNSSHSSLSNELTMDVTFNYLRGSQSDQPTDLAPRVTVGGMFSEWLGLDFQGLYTTRSNNFLVGADLRLSPVDWFYLRGGIGGYADKATREFTVTPVGASGIRIRFNRDTYLLTEVNYYQVNHRDYMGIGAGIGLIF